MTTSEWVILAAIVLYMIMMIAIGVGVSRKTKTSDDFYLGGRKLGPLVTAMSAEASDMSAYLLMGIPGLALMCGLAEATWTAIGLAVPQLALCRKAPAHLLREDRRGDRTVLLLTPLRR